MAPVQLRTVAHRLLPLSGTHQTKMRLPFPPPPACQCPSENAAGSSASLPEVAAASGTPGQSERQSTGSAIGALGPQGGSSRGLESRDSSSSTGQEGGGTRTPGGPTGKGAGANRVCTRDRGKDSSSSPRSSVPPSPPPSGSITLPRDSTDDKDGGANLLRCDLMWIASGNKGGPITPVEGCELHPIIIVRNKEGRVFDDDEQCEENPIGKSAHIFFRWMRGPPRAVCTFHSQRTACLQCVVTLRCFCSYDCFRKGYKQLHKFYRTRGLASILPHPNSHTYGVPCRPFDWNDLDANRQFDTQHLALLRQAGLVAADDEEEEQWQPVSSSRNYTPTKADVGHQLRFEALLVDRSHLSRLLRIHRAEQQRERGGRKLGRQQRMQDDGRELSLTSTPDDAQQNDLLESGAAITENDSHGRDGVAAVPHVGAVFETRVEISSSDNFTKSTDQSTMSSSSPPQLKSSSTAKAFLAVSGGDRHSRGNNLVNNSVFSAESSASSTNDQGSLQPGAPAPVPGVSPRGGNSSTRSSRSEVVSLPELTDTSDSGDIITDTYETAEIVWGVSNSLLPQDPLHYRQVSTGCCVPTVNPVRRWRRRRASVPPAPPPPPPHVPLMQPSHHPLCGLPQPHPALQSPLSIHPASGCPPGGPHAQLDPHVVLAGGGGGGGPADPFCFPVLSPGALLEDNMGGYNGLHASGAGDGGSHPFNSGAAGRGGSGGAGGGHHPHYAGPFFASPDSTVISGRNSSCPGGGNGSFASLFPSSGPSGFTTGASSPFPNTFASSSSLPANDMMPPYGGPLGSGRGGMNTGAPHLPSAAGGVLGGPSSFYPLQPTNGKSPDLEHSMLDTQQHMLPFGQQHPQGRDSQMFGRSRRSSTSVETDSAYGLSPEESCASSTGGDTPRGTDDGERDVTAKEDGSFTPCSSRNQRQPQHCRGSSSAHRQEPLSAEDASRFRVTVMTWNVLAELYGTLDAFPHCDAYMLAWPYRRERILEEIISQDPDIVCLQVMN